MQLKFNELINKNLGFILFSSMLILSLFTYDQYGLGWDEHDQRLIGEVNYDYVFKGDQKLLTWVNRDYGVAFELPLILIERGLGLTDMRDVFLMRHFVSHLFFLIGAYFFFLLIDLLYKNKILAAIGFLMIVLNPTLYGHSFFNSKDIPFMSMFMISLYQTVKSFSFKSNKNFIVLGLCLAILANLRIMGLMLPGCIAIMLLLDGVIEKKIRLNFKYGLILTSSTSILLYLTWPFLWLNPFVNLFNGFVNMSSFRWNQTLLFNGKDTLQKDLDWFYSIEWFSISNPLFYLIVGFLGVIFLVFKSIKNPLALFSNTFLRNNALFLICFSSPIIIVSVLHSVLYDCWRQLFFIYPSFILLGIYSLNVVYTRFNGKYILLIPFISFIWVASFMIQNFPFQHVYFNSYFSNKPNEYLRKNFELDYWGVSYLNSLEYILKNDKSKCLDICVDHTAGIRSGDLLKIEDRKRINFMFYNEIKSCKYFITNYRWHPQEYSELKKYSYYKTKVKGNTINEVFKLR